MEQRELSVIKRSEAGTSAARRLRRQGLVPAILYGRGVASVSLAIDARVLREVIHASGHNVVVRLKIENGGEDAPTVILREVQRHPLTGMVLNADFQRISLTEKITAQVPVVLVGEAPGIKLGGVIEHILREVEVEALPTELPEHLELDVSNLQVGQTLHASDLTPPPGVTMITEPGDVIVSIAVPRAIEEVAPAAAAPAAEEAPEAAEAEEEKPEAEGEEA